MAVAEITSETTPEEIEAFVDVIAAEREGEKAPPEKTDAEIVNDVASIETPVASKGDETAPASKAKSEKTEDRAWLNDDLKSEVAAYGIGEDELADFTSREELDRALRLFDKSALEAGRKAMADGESSGTTRDDKGRFVPKGTTETPAPEPEKTPAKTGGYEVKLSKETYDDGLVDELTQMRDYYEERLGVLEARFLEADAKAEEARFDDAIDKLDMPKLFGKTGSESKEEKQRRHDLMVQCKAKQFGLQQLTGRSVEIESLAGREARMAFADDFTKKELKSRTSRISRQSNSRMGGGATRPDQPRESAREEADRLFRELAGS